MSGDRPQRLGRLLKEEISRLFQEEINDPAIKAVKLLSVTDVLVSADLKVANVYVSLFADQAPPGEVFGRICRAASFIRLRISENLKDLKFIPEIRFHEDKTPEEAARIMSIFHRLEEEKAKNKKTDESLKKNKRPAKKK